MPRTGVQYVGNDEPSFIKQFKQRIGHKEGPTVDTKRHLPSDGNDASDSDDAVEKEDEKPVVVVLGTGDLTAEEANIAKKEIEDGPARLDDKIVFKKPTKRSTEDQGEANKAKDTIGPKKKKEANSTSKAKHSSAKKTKNSSLLSFADDEDEDDL